MKAIGFTLGLRGDIIISTVAARAFKEANPDSKLTLGIHKDFADMTALFGGHKYYDDYHLYESYADWPNYDDLNFLSRNKFDIVFHGMPKRSNEADWWKTEHQAANMCSVYNLPKPSSYQCSLEKCFEIPDYKGYIGFQPFGGWQDWPNKKSFSLERAQEVVNLIISLGYKVLQFGGPEEPALVGAEKFINTYSESMKAMLGCKMLLTVDTGRCWVSSAYSYPTLGLYANGYYGRQYISSIQPINPNAQYLDEETVDKISNDQICIKIKEIIS